MSDRPDRENNEYGEKKGKRHPQLELYLAARSEWTERYRDFIHTNQLLRRLVGLLGACCVLLIVGLIVVGTQAKTIPFVVELDELGSYRGIGPVESTDFADDRLLRAQLIEIVRSWRTVVGDRTAQKAMVERAHALARGAASERLREDFRERAPFEVMRKRTIEVEITSVMTRGDKTFDVTWREHARTLEGRRVGTRGFRGVFEAEFDPDYEPDFSNPLGIFITRISFTEPIQ